jgi:hypothetical protein
VRITSWAYRTQSLAKQNSRWSNTNVLTAINPKLAQKLFEYMER